MLISQSFTYQSWGQISVITRYIHPKISSSSARFCGQNDRLFVDKFHFLGLWRPQKLESENTSSVFSSLSSSGHFYNVESKSRLQPGLLGRLCFSVWKKKDFHPPKSLFSGLTLGFLEVSPTSSCSEIVVSSNNSTSPKFALSSLAEAIQVHRFKGKFDATASSKIAVPLMAKAISTASLG